MPVSVFVLLYMSRNASLIAHNKLFARCMAVCGLKVTDDFCARVCA